MYDTESYLKTLQLFTWPRGFLISSNTNFHHRLHRSTLLELAWSNKTSHLISLRFILTLSSHICVCLSNDFISLRSSVQNFVSASYMLHACYKHKPSEYSQSNQRNDKIIASHFKNFYPVFFYLISRKFRYTPHSSKPILVSLTKGPSFTHHNLYTAPWTGITEK